MTVWLPAELVELAGDGDALAECECRECAVRWVDRVLMAQCWLCSSMTPYVRPLEQSAHSPRHPSQVTVEADGCGELLVAGGSEL